jgi:hypothetical protein|tara:strand:+ start:407 stop:550 length:144 start_codon:yes stop_codon:yes gene_type:complete
MMGGYFEEPAHEVDLHLGNVIAGRDTAGMTTQELLDAANQLYQILSY